MLLVVALAALLGPSDYGRFALVFTLVAVLSSSVSVGGPTLASRLLPGTAQEHRVATARRLTRRLGRWRALEAASLIVVILILAALDPADFPPILCGLGSLALLLDLAATLLFQIGLGLGRVAMFSFRFPVQNGLVVAGVLALYPVFGVPGAVAAIAASAAAVLLWGMRTVGRTLMEPAAGAGEPPEISPAIWRFGLHQGIGGVLVTVVYRGGIIATALLAGSSRQQGFAALAIGVGVAATYVVSQAFTVSLPRLVELSQRAADAAEDEAARFTWRAVVLTGFLAIGAAFAVKPGVPFALGSGFRGSESALYVGIALVPLAAPAALVAQVAALRLSSRRLLVGRALGAVVFVAVSVAAIPRHGALGALAAVFAGVLTTLLASAASISLPGGRRLIAVGLAASTVVLVIGALT
jgi:O-antigen/teichoic acid export membrane protein